MRSSKPSLPLAMALLVIGSQCALAGSQSLLDPYAGIQAPSSNAAAKPAKQQKKAAPAAAAPQAPQSTTTYVTMPGTENQPKPGASAKASDGTQPGLMSGMSDIKEGCSKTVKAAGAGIVGGTKAASNKIVEGTKFVGHGVAKGTRRIGDGIATGAKASGNYIARGAKAIGNGLKATGTKVKEGTGAVGSKVAGLPKVLKLKKGDTPSTAVATTSQGPSTVQATPRELTPSPMANNQTSTVQSTPAVIATPVTARNSATAGGGGLTKKVAAIPSNVASSMGKAFGKIKMFGRGSNNNSVKIAPNTGAVPQ